MATASFMAFHTSIFISRIEPNLTFAWLASFLIEAMLISLALMRTWVSRVLLIPLFLISVMAASASFVVKNEGTLEQFIQSREAQAQTGQTVESLKSDLAETQKEFDLGAKYTTSTLKRERVIKDRIEQVMSTAKGQAGQLTLFNSAMFFVLVLVLQLVSIYTAMSLKNGLSHTALSQSQASETTAVSHETVRQACENRRKGGAEKLETEEVESQDLSTGENQKSGDGSSAAEEVLRLKAQGMKPDDIAKQTGLSRATVYRLLKQGGEGK